MRLWSPPHADDFDADDEALARIRADHGASIERALEAQRLSAAHRPTMVEALVGPWSSAEPSNAANAANDGVGARSGRWSVAPVTPWRVEAGPWPLPFDEAFHTDGPELGEELSSSLLTECDEESHPPSGLRFRSAPLSQPPVETLVPSRSRWRAANSAG